MLRHSSMDIKEIAKNEIRDVFISEEGLKELLGNDVYQHSERVCDFAIIIGQAYNFNLQDLIDLAVGSLLHDIGKAYVNSLILQKAGKLTKNERVLIEQHPHEGYCKIKNLDFNKRVVDIIHYHHERLDASGYPEKNSRKKIGILTQIVSVADVYEALTTKRVYHEPYSREEAFQIMKAQPGLNQTAITILEEYVASQDR